MFESHLSTSRLNELSAEAVVFDAKECRHLLQCEQCVMLLREFAHDRIRKFEDDRAGEYREAA